jgi:uncharacterized protein
VKRKLVAALGWLSFALGWVGVFLPGLPTTIFWILAALAFMRTNERMYRRILSDRRFGPGIRLFVEEGRISGRGKLVSIAMMMGCAAAGALAIPPVWVKILVMAAAAAGSALVWSLPTAGATPAKDASAAREAEGS